MTVTPEDWASDSLELSQQSTWDLVVVGGGTAGIVAAKTAAGLGADVLLIERERPGGDCLWTGCVPSKALLSAPHAAAGSRRMGEFGLRSTGIEVDFAGVMAHVHAAIATIEPVDSPATLRMSGVRVVHGDATFTGMSTLSVDGRNIDFRHALIATGSSPSIPSVPGLVESSPLTSDSIWSLETLPAHLLVMGGGSIGCELGQAFARLGSQVSLVESGPRILLREDSDAAEAVATSLVADGVSIRVGAAIVSVSDRGPVVATLSDGSNIKADRILVAVGRRPRLGGLGLESAGVDLNEAGFVSVDARLRTTNRRIWAAGDITGHPQFTHVAGNHGSLAASNAVLGLRRKVDIATVPRVTYTDPEVAAFGVDLERADRLGLRTRTVDHAEVDRAVTEGRVSGYSRLVLDKRGRIVGASLVGPRAGESLAEAVLAARHGLRARDIAASMHPYPTYGDGVWKAGLAQVQDDLSGRLVQRVVRLLILLRRFLAGR